MKVGPSRLLIWIYRYLYGHTMNQQKHISGVIQRVESLGMNLAAGMSSLYAGRHSVLAAALPVN